MVCNVLKVGGIKIVKFDKLCELVFIYVIVNIDENICLIVDKLCEFILYIIVMYFCLLEDNFVLY